MKNRAGLLDPWKIPGWSEDSQSAALQCFLRRADDRASNAQMARELQRLRMIADAIDRNRKRGAREFFEDHFVAMRKSSQRRPGFVTGYYEPELAASTERSDRFSVPLYRFPDEHSPFWKKFPAGTMPDRRQIDEGALAGMNLELAWLESAIDAFFVHVQGSARLRLRDGTTTRIGFAGRNGYPYTSIGAVLIDKGEMTASEVTMATLRNWLTENPGLAGSVMAANRSYIFFRQMDGEEEAGPVGAAGVPLQPGRSLAVDEQFVPFGAPVWIATHNPAPQSRSPLRRLMVAQDTGSAIKGPARGDIFVGSGSAAGEIAGAYKHECEFFVFVPRALAGGK